MKERNKAVPAAYVILEKDGKVLLLRRFNTGYQDGNYSLPAGHVEAGEMPTDTAVREAKEEVGITLDSVQLSIAHVLYRESQDVTGDRTDIFFRAMQWTGKIKNCEPNKCDDLSWYPLDNLPSNMTTELKHMFSQISRGAIFSELRATQ